MNISTQIKLSPHIHMCGEFLAFLKTLGPQNITILRHTKKNIVLVVLSLVSLRKDQVATIVDKEITHIYLSDKEKIGNVSKLQIDHKTAVC